MKAFRIALSTALGVAIFYCSSALSQMSSPYVYTLDIVQADETRIESALPVESSHTTAEAVCGDFDEVIYDSEIKDLEEEEYWAQRPDEIYENGQVHSNLEEVSYSAKEYKLEKCKAYTPAQKELIARVVYAEARGELFEGQVAVATVVLNRYESGLYGSSISEIVFAQDQFAITASYNESGLKAVEEALGRRGDYPFNMYYFRVSKSKKWRNFVYYMRIGNHSFYLSGD